MMNSMLLSSGLSEKMWGETILSACYILNRVPHKKLDKTSYELWKGFVPNLKFLKVWGCLAKVGVPDFKCVNVGSKTSDTVFIGYAQNSVAYRVMSLRDHPICESRDAKNFEHIFSVKINVPSDAQNNASTSMSVISHVVPSSNDISNEHENELRKSKRGRIEISFCPNFITTFLTENFDTNVLNN